MPRLGGNRDKRRRQRNCAETLPRAIYHLRGDRFDRIGIRNRIFEWRIVRFGGGFVPGVCRFDLGRFFIFDDANRWGRQARTRGGTMAVYSMLGYFGVFLGPLALGAILDLAGGIIRTPGGWRSCI